jgi:hypothetical protein
MKTKFNNFARKIGKKNFGESELKWYKWRVFVDEDDSILKKIKFINYILDPTYRDPNRRSFDILSKFALEDEGQSSFTIFGTIHYKNDVNEDFEYYLDIAKSWPKDIN